MQSFTLAPSVLISLRFERPRLYRLRKKSPEGARSVRARLQSCRKGRKMNVGFSPCGPLFGPLLDIRHFSAASFAVP